MIFGGGDWNLSEIPCASWHCPRLHRRLVTRRAMQLPDIGNLNTKPAPTPAPGGLHDFVQVVDDEDDRELSRFLGELKPSSLGNCDDESNVQTIGSAQDAMLAGCMAELQADPTEHGPC